MTINKSKYLMLAIGAAALLAVVAIASAMSAALGPAAQPTPVPVTSPAPVPAPVPTPVGKGDCTIGGCSSEVCSDLSQGPAISACVLRPEFVCYKSAKCERQPDGQCGWTPTPELNACLKSPPPLK